MSVKAGDSLGITGGTGFGINYWAPHLHFELKSFSTLGTSGDDSGEWGYTLAPPDAAGYFNPIVNLHSGSDLTAPVQVQTLGSQGVLVGPGGNGRTSYRTFTGFTQGVYFYALRSAPATSVPSCSQGWYQIVQPDGSNFKDGQGSGQMLEGWACINLLRVIQ